MSFSWRRGALHSAIPLGLLVAASAVMIGTNHVAHVDKFTEGVTRLSLFVIALGFAMSYLWQAGRRRSAVALGATLVVGLAALFGGALLARHTPATVSEADRAPLIAYDDHGQHRLRHATLGFSILDPGFAPSAAIADAFQHGTKDDPQSWSYGYLKGTMAAPEIAVVVAVLDDVDFSETEFRRTVEGINKGLRSGLHGVELKVTADDLVWTATQHESHLRATMAGDVDVLINTFAVRPANHEPYLVALTCFTHDPHAVDQLLASFQAN